MGKLVCKERDLSCFSVGEKEAEKLRPRGGKGDMGGDLGGVKRLGPSAREQMLSLRRRRPLGIQENNRGEGLLYYYYFSFGEWQAISRIGGGLFFFYWTSIEF